MPLPLIIRKNIKDCEPKKAENMAKINSILGEKFTFECDFETVHR